MVKANIKLRRLAFLNLFIFLIMLILVPMTFAADKVYRPRFSYHWFPDHNSAKMADLFVKEAKIATGGRLDIQVFPSGQLFKIAQIVPAISQGSVEMGGVVDVIYMRVDKDFYLMGFGRFFNSFQQKRDFWLKNPEGRRVWDRLEKKLGIKTICFIPVGPALYTSTSQPLNKLSNFKGLKARTLIPTEKPTLKALGVNYVAVNTSEVYSALKQGMINMVATVPNAIKGYNWWDYLKYGQLPYYLYADAFITVNAKWWNSLPQDIRDIVLNEVGPKVSKIATDQVMKISNDILEEWERKHNGTVSTLSGSDLQKFKEIEYKKAHPVLARAVDPVLYKAAKKHVGIE